MIQPIGPVVSALFARGDLPRRIVAVRGPWAGTVFQYSDDDRAYVEHFRVCFLLAEFVRRNWLTEFRPAPAVVEQMELQA